MTTQNAIVLSLPGIPFTLAPAGAPPCAAEQLAGGLQLTGGSGSDLFVDPCGDGSTFPDAGRWLGVPPDGDFTLAARVTVGFESLYDAGAILLHASERRWAKLCFEYSPQRVPTAVTVVTRGFSDDCNSFEVAEDSLWLRVTRTGRAWAFHASTDGKWWRLLRLFELGEAEAGEQVQVGFLAQAPTGRSCTARFTRLAYAPGAPADLRDGS